MFDYSIAIRTEIDPFFVWSTMRSWSYEISSIVVFTSLDLGTTLNAIRAAMRYSSQYARLWSC